MSAESEGLVFIKAYPNNYADDGTIVDYKEVTFPMANSQGKVTIPIRYSEDEDALTACALLPLKFGNDDDGDDDNYDNADDDDAGAYDIVPKSEMYLGDAATKMKIIEKNFSYSILAINVSKDSKKNVTKVSLRINVAPKNKETAVWLAQTDTEEQKKKAARKKRLEAHRRRQRSGISRGTRKSPSSSRNSEAKKKRNNNDDNNNNNDNNDNNNDNKNAKNSPPTLSAEEKFINRYTRTGTVCVYITGDPVPSAAACGEAETMHLYYGEYQRPNDWDHTCMLGLSLSICRVEIACRQSLVKSITLGVGSFFTSISDGMGY